MSTSILPVRRLASGSLYAALLLALNGMASAIPIADSPTFTSLDQSMWGTGDALQFDKTQFIGTTWNKSTSVGGFVGGETQILNPLWVAWNICPFLCGSAPQKFFEVDTTTGLQVSASTTGRIGFELGMSMDSGSLDALVNYATTVTVPEAGAAGAGEFIDLNPTSSLNGDNLESQFPTMSASLAVVMEVSASFAATGCAAGLCDTASFSTGKLGGTQELISFNEDGQGGIEYFGGSGFLSDALDTAVDLGLVDLPTGFPAALEIPVPAGLGNLGTITAHLPQPNADYDGLNAAGTALTASGQDDLLDVSIDVDNLLSVGLTGVGGLFGGSESLGAGFSLSYDLINVEMGPQLNLVQRFELTPTLYVDLQFSQPVNVFGIGNVMSVAGLKWSDLPTMAFLGGTTSILPTFYLGTSINGSFMSDAAELLNQLLLDVDGNIKVDLLTATFGTPFGDRSLGIGNLLNHTFDVFSTPPLFSTKFAMAGFDPYVGAAFTVTVPEPSALALLGAGLIVLALRARRRTRGRSAV